MLALRIVYTFAVLALLVWLLRSGLPLGAVLLVAAAVWLRRSVEAARERAAT